jgi:hypothetical protein
MPIDPNIAMGYRGIELQNPLAQYGQIAAIQNAQNQNALAQFQLGSARRQEESQNALSQAYQSSINPETGQLDPKMLISNVARSKAAHLLPDIQGKLLESQTKQATLAKTTQETEAGKFKLTKDKLNAGWMSMGEASTPQAAIEKLQDGVKQGYFDQATAEKETQLIMSMTPDQYKQYRIQKVMGLLDAKDQLGAMLPKIARQDIGASVIGIQDNPALEGYGQPIPGMSIPKTQTFADITAAKQATTSAGQLNLAREKFAFEQANPGMTIQEDANGLLAVNNRTGVATPVVYGPTGFQAAPAAAPAAPAAGPSVMRQQGAGMPGQRVAAIPGMTSVLDQTAAPAAAAMALPNVEGARIAGQPVGSKKEAPAKFTETDMQLANLAGSVNAFRNEVAKNKNTSAKWLPTGEDTANMSAKYISLLMGVKDLYQLGAITGPDLPLIEAQITNPSSWAGKFTTKKGFEAQIKSVEDMIERGATNLENTYGRVPKGTRKALQTTPLGSAESGIPNATATNPLGLVIPGVR